MDMFKYSLIILSFFLMISCSPQRRLQRLIKNHPELNSRVEYLEVHDTIITEPIKADTTVLMTKEYDTIQITKDLLKIKIIRHFDTLKVQGECASDTIYKTIQAPYTKIEVKSSFWDKYGEFFIILIVLAIIYWGARKFGK